MTSPWDTEWSTDPTGTKRLLKLTINVAVDDAEILMSTGDNSRGGDLFGPEPWYAGRSETIVFDFSPGPFVDDRRTVRASGASTASARWTHPDGTLREEIWVVPS